MPSAATHCMASDESTFSSHETQAGAPRARDVDPD